MRNQLASSAALRVLLVLVVTTAAVSGFFWARGRRSANERAAISPSRDETATSPVSADSPTRPALSPSASTTSANQSPVQSATDSKTEQTPTLESDQASTNQSKDGLLSGNFVGTLKLIIPVVGVKPDQLQDTFTDARAEGRVHDAIDISAPAGTPVVAAADGEIIKLFQSERGGTTIYQLSPDKKLVFYYAHLQRYADGLMSGRFVKHGEVIGYVGDTGNAGGGNYHLHFSISVIADPKRYWEGTNINPYPLLRR